MSDTNLLMEFREYISGGAALIFGVLFLRRKYSSDNVALNEDKAQMTVLNIVQLERAEAMKRINFLQEQLDLATHKANSFEHKCLYLSNLSHAQQTEIKILKEDLGSSKSRLATIIGKSTKGKYDPTHSDIMSGL